MACARGSVPKMVGCRSAAAPSPRWWRHLRGARLPLPAIVGGLLLELLFLAALLLLELLFLAALLLRSLHDAGDDDDDDDDDDAEKFEPGHGSQVTGHRSQVW